MASIGFLFANLATGRNEEIKAARKATPNIAKTTTIFGFITENEIEKFFASSTFIKKEKAKVQITDKTKLKRAIMQASE